MRTAKPWIRCLTAIILVSKAVAVAASLEAPLTVLIYDHAHVGPKTLAQAERVASEIFGRAAIEVRWMTRSVSDGEALLNDFSAATTKACGQPLDSATVTVEILPHAPSGFSPQALGYALPYAERGMQVTSMQTALNL